MNSINFPSVVLSVLPDVLFCSLVKFICGYKNIEMFTCSQILSTLLKKLSTQLNNFISLRNSTTAVFEVRTYVS
jgi:hypothetical protein